MTGLHFWLLLKPGDESDYSVLMNRMFAGYRKLEGLKSELEKVAA